MPLSAAIEAEASLAFGTCYFLGVLVSLYNCLAFGVWTKLLVPANSHFVVLLELLILFESICIDHFLQE